MKKLLGLLLVLAMLVSCAPTKVLETIPEAPVVETGTAGDAFQNTSAPTEVKFGFIGPLTGDISSLGVPIKDAVTMAVDEVNANNVIPGKTLTMLYEDDACEPAKTTTSIHKLADIDKVAAVVGPACSGSVLAAAPIAEGAKLLFISYAATNPTVKTAGDYIFRNVPSDAGQGVAGAGLVQKLGAKKVAIIYRNNDWGVGLKDVFSTEATKLGRELVATESYDPDSKDFKTQVSKIKDAKPDAIYMLSFPAEATILLKQIDEAGLKVQIIGADGSKDDAVVGGAGKAAEGFIVTLPAVPKTPELDAFNEKFKAKYGKEYSAYTAEGYDAVNILAKACAATDCTSTAMKDHLYSMGEYKGASGTYSFDKDGEVQKSYDYWQVQNGTWVAYTQE